MIVDAWTDAGRAPLPISLVGADVMVACGDGRERRSLSLDSAAPTVALPAVARRVGQFLTSCSSGHRGAGYRSRHATHCREQSRTAALGFAGRPQDGDDIAIVCRNTTEAVNHLAYRLCLSPPRHDRDNGDRTSRQPAAVGRLCHRRHLECGPGGTVAVDDVIDTLDRAPRPKLLATTRASNVTGWLAPLDAIIDAVHDRGIATLIDAAQLAPHRRLPFTSPACTTRS
jgi:selenocysteine lyase/cysteine desulfurase